MARLRDLESQVAHFMEPDQKAAVGERLRLARENSPFTQRELADAANVELRTYQFWEQGRGISRKGVDAIARRLGIDPDEIWEGRPEVDHLAALEERIAELTAELRTHDEFARAKAGDVQVIRDLAMDRINERLATVEQNQLEMMALGETVIGLLRLLVPDEQALVAESLLDQLNVAREIARDSVAAGEAPATKANSG